MNEIIAAIQQANQQQLSIHQEYNKYPDIIEINEHNPCLDSPYAPYHLYFEQTKETLADPSVFNNFIRNAEHLFRVSREYKSYKSYLMQDIGINRCQVLGNITSEDADIELHHNVLGLYDICILITLHIINTIGKITTYDLVQHLIQVHYNNMVGVTFLSKTAHQVFTADNEGFIPPEQTFGAWWLLLKEYRFGITFDIANKILKYLNKYQNKTKISINLEQQEQLLSYAAYNDYGTPLNEMDMSVQGFYTEKEVDE